MSSKINIAKDNHPNFNMDEINLDDDEIIYNVKKMGGSTNGSVHRAGSPHLFNLSNDDINLLPGGDNLKNKSVGSFDFGTENLFDKLNKKKNNIPDKKSGSFNDNLSMASSKERFKAFKQDKLENHDKYINVPTLGQDIINDLKNEMDFKKPLSNGSKDIIHNNIEDNIGDINIDFEELNRKIRDDDDIFGDDKDNTKRSNHSKKSDITSNNKKKNTDDLDNMDIDDLLSELDELKSKHNIHIPSHFNRKTPPNEVRDFIRKQRRRKDKQNAQKLGAKFLLTTITALEFLNDRFDPFELKLDGWSEKVHEDIDDYNDVFAELYEKYKTSTQIAPEIKLIMMLGGSAAMVHVSNSMYNSQTSKPDLPTNDFTEASNPNNGEPIRTNQNIFSHPPPEFKPEPPVTQCRREMRGPTGVDESILRELENSCKPKKPESPRPQPTTQPVRPIQTEQSTKNKSLDNKSKISINENGRKTIKLNI
jgi:hypothetical protein